MKIYIAVMSIIMYIIHTLCIYTGHSRINIRFIYLGKFYLLFKDIQLGIYKYLIIIYIIIYFNFMSIFFIIHCVCYVLQQTYYVHLADHLNWGLFWA